MVKVRSSATQQMDLIYRYQRHVYDLTRKPFLLGRNKLLQELLPPKNGYVLEVGCGTGRNLIRAAQIYKDVCFLGIDVSQAMLEIALQRIRSAMLTSRVLLAHADATQFDGGVTFGRAEYDKVFISYALSMMPAWRETLTRAFQCLAPGGSLHIVDFGQQERMPNWFKISLEAWLKLFAVTPQPGLREELERIAKKQGAKLQFTSLYRGYTHYAVLRKT